jgi:release factor glutamine methyltransferase
MTWLTLKKNLQQQLLQVYNAREAENIAYLVLENFTNLTKTQILISEKNVDKQVMDEIDCLLKKLLQNVPIQQVLGYAWFYNYKFKIDENVLIPRPETEELVDLIVKENKGKNLSMIDIGTGSGCIAISLKKEENLFAIAAIDISKNALAIAQKNSDLLAAKIDFFEIDFLNENNWSQLHQYDIIVSNPPYISHAEKENIKGNVLLHEPHIALFTPNDDYLIFYNAIANFAVNHLKKNGCIYVEVNEHFANETANVFKTYSFQSQILKDFQGKDRIIKAYR